MFLIDVLAQRSSHALSRALQDSADQTTQPPVQPDCKHSPTEVNTISFQTVRARAIALLAADDAAARSLPRLASAVTNLLLYQVFKSVWSLDRQELGKWSKQRAFARVVASISGCRLPSFEDAERPGQRMHEFVSRYETRHRTAVQSEKRAQRRADAVARAAVESDVGEEGARQGRPSRSKAAEARVELEEAIYICRYGCTPACVPSIRLPPGLAPKKVDQTPMCVMDVNMALLRENAVLRRLEGDAVQMLKAKLQQSSTDLTSSVTAEHTALCAIERERKRMHEVELENEAARANLKDAKLQKRDLERALKTKEGEVLVLGAKVARAHFELSRQQQLCDKSQQDLAQKSEDIETIGAQATAQKLELEEKCKEMSKQIDLQCKRFEALQLRLGSHVTRVNMELVSLQRSFEHEKMALLREKSTTQEDLRKAHDDLDRLRRLKNEMAKKKRAAEKGKLKRAADDWKELSLQKHLCGTFNRSMSLFTRTLTTLLQLALKDNAKAKRRGFFSSFR